MKQETNRQETAPGHRLIRLPEVIQMVGLKRSAIYDKIKRGEFPKPISLGPRAVGWILAETDKWIDDRIDASRKIEGGC